MQAVLSLFVLVLVLLFLSNVQVWHRGVSAEGCFVHVLRARECRLHVLRRLNCRSVATCRIRTSTLSLCAQTLCSQRQQRLATLSRPRDKHGIMRRRKLKRLQTHPRTRPS